MDNQKFVTINVGGKLYQTTKSTIELWPDTTVGMLLRHRPDDAEIFIDRDSKMFRWILYWYQTGILVDHTTVCVPEEVWNHELAFYGIREEDLQQAEERGGQSLGDMSQKRRRLAEKSAAIEQKAREAVAVAAAHLDDEKIRRESLYGDILAYMIDGLNKSNLHSSTVFTFIGRSSNNGRDVDYPHMYDNRARFNPVWLKYWFAHEFVSYCSQLGFVVEVIEFNGNTTRRKFDHLPASHTDMNMSKSFISIRIKTK